MKNVVDNLIEWQMYDLYKNIEMPLVFTLNNMEVEGIGVDKNALKEYGESLVGRIDYLEKEIYPVMELFEHVFEANYTTVMYGGEHVAAIIERRYFFLVFFGTANIAPTSFIKRFAAFSLIASALLL